MKIYDKCPVCEKQTTGGIRRTFFGHSVLGSIQIDELFTKVVENETEGQLSICKSCRLVYNKKFFNESELAYIYNKGYFLMEERIKDLPGFVYEDKLFLSGYSERIYKKVKFLESKTKANLHTIYDIGGRDGFMLNDLANDGYNCTVFDPIPRKSFSEKIKKVDVWASQIDVKEPADVILLCDVLSHCIDPKQEVINCCHFLKEGGYLYIEVPYDIGTFFYWMMFCRWRNKSLSIDVTHFSYFSIRSILKLMNIANLDVVHISYDTLSATDNVLVMNVIAKKQNNLERMQTPEKYSFLFDLFKTKFFKALVSRFFKILVSKIH